MKTQSAKIIGGERKVWRGVGGVEAEAGLDPGREEGHSAIYRHGRDQAGSSASAEDLADGCGAIHTIHGSALDFHGFQDGGGLTHTTMDIGDFHGASIDL